MSSDGHGPGFGEVMEAFLQDRTAQIAVAVPGEVTAWNSLTETVAVTPQVHGPDGAPRPTVPQCPVLFVGPYWDIQIGEQGLLVICDHDIETWWRTGQASAPPTRQSHRMGNAVFIPGIRPMTSPRVHKTGAAILERPAALGEVLLGTPTATKAALHEDFLSALNTFLTALDTWGTAVGVATAVPWATGPQPSLNAIKVGISAGSYQSPSVKVEN